ncbi:MAG: homoserine kinase [Pseudomonadota bacterium]
MAVYTYITLEEAEEFIRNYDIGSALKLTEIKQGIENTNYFLDTSTGRYVLTLFEKRVDEKDLPYFLGFSEHLSHNGISCPKPVKDKNGQFLHHLKGRPATLITFLEGTSHDIPSVNDCLEAGSFFAKLHIAQAGFAGYRKNDLSLAGWKNIYHRLEGRADSVHQGLDALLHQEITFQSAHMPSDLPVGQIHADLFTDNVFFKAGKISGVIDFYFSCTDMLAYDLAICLNGWAFDANGCFLPDHAAALLKGYNAIRPLQENEKQGFSILLRGAALRFLLTRTFDWINQDADALVTPKNPMQYFYILKFHRENILHDTLLAG